MTLTSDDFRAKIEATDNVESLVHLFDAGSHVSWDVDEVDTYRQLFEKAFCCTSTLDEAITLWNTPDLFSTAAGFHSDPEFHEEAEAKLENRVLERMIELTKTEDDLWSVYGILASDVEAAFVRRNFLRKVFDKADELGYRTR